MAWARAALASLVAGAAGMALVSGGSGADPRTPAALPGLPPPFIGTAVVGDGELTAAIDSYGNVVDLRAPGPAGRALIDNPVERQKAGTVAPGTGIVPRAQIGRAWLPLWRADSVEQRYRSGTNVLLVEAVFGAVRVRIDYGVAEGTLACLARVGGASGPGPRVSIGSDEGAASSRLRCNDRWAAEALARAVRADRAWLSRALPLGPEAPTWAREMYGRSLLTLRALTDRRSGAVAAGARDGWAYVWPRDAGAAALAFAAAGYEGEAKRVALFLLDLDLGAAARFHGDGTPVPGREAQGDASGWVAVAAKAAGLPVPTESLPWRDRADYQERDRGNYLGNALAGASAGRREGRLRGSAEWRERQPRGTIALSKPLSRDRSSRRVGLLVRDLDDPHSGLDSVAAWAVRPFPQSALYTAARRTLLRLAAERSLFGIVPSQDWDGTNPWSAPTAWTAWSLAALGERREALRLLAALCRSATPAGALPERVDSRTGIPASTTPLSWSHAFAILALRELWP